MSDTRVTATDRELAAALADALGRAGNQETEELLIAAFAEAIRKQGAGNRAEAILEAYAQHAEQEGSAPLTAKVAHDMTIPGAAVEVQPELIAGVRMVRGDVRVDASVQGRMQKLRNALSAH